LACTCAAVTPGLSRPITCSHHTVGADNRGHGGHAGRRRLDRRELTVERERHGDVRAVTKHLLHADELRRDDTDDRHRHVVEAHNLADDLGIAAEAASASTAR